MGLRQKESRQVNRRTRNAQSGILPALSVLMALALACCGPDRVAGGYDDVENPALTVSLLDTAGQAFGNGEVRIYARYQSPLKDSLPVLAQPVAAGATFVLSDTALISAMGRSHARGTPWPSPDSIPFNLMATAPAGEALVTELLLVRTGSGKFRFQRRAGGSILYPDASGKLEVSPRLPPPVLGQRGSVGAHGLDLRLKSVFIPGSPYRASVADDGTFELARMAAGRHDLKAVDADNKVWSALDSLDTAAPYSASDWSEADIIWIE
jgi:hypothetical protein